MTPEKLTRLAVIAGAMKCGTTTLFEMLASHPQIAPCADKEPCFFASPYRWAAGLAAYEALFDIDPSRHRWALEATTDYAKLPYLDYVFDRMKQVEDLSFRFVYIMRRPEDRIRSHIVHARVTGTEILSLKLQEPGARDLNGVPKSAIDITRYAYHVERYQEAFGPDNVLLLVFEDLVAQPDVVLDQLCDFLEIDRVALPTVVHANRASDKTKVSSFWETLRGVGAFKQAYDRLPFPVRQGLYHRFGRAEHDLDLELRDDQVETINAELEDDLLRLRDVHGIDVEAKWGVSLPPAGAASGEGGTGSPRDAATPRGPGAAS